MSTTDGRQPPPRGNGEEFVRLLGGLNVVTRRMLVAVIAMPVVAVGTVWLAVQLDRWTLLLGLPSTVAGFALGLRAIWRYSREAEGGDLVGERGQGPLMVAAVLMLAGICLPLYFVAAP